VRIEIEDDARAFIRERSEKDRRIIGEYIERLTEHPDAQGNIKKLKTRKPRWRMHISSKYTVFYYVADDTVYIDHIMSQELAHKKYGKI
jgi:mRNA-degrading endonuclease RelE of RelBE toxin-antitoxin system